MKVLVVHHAVDQDSSLDECDVIIQAEVVSQALHHLGHESMTVACSLNLDALCRQVKSFAPDLIFNLVESLQGQGRLIHLFPFMLDSFAIHYSGASAEAVYSTSHKLVAKKQMAAVGLPTPPWIGPCPPFAPPLGQKFWFEDRKKKNSWIIKSVWEHASLGLDGNALLHPKSVEDLYQAMRKRRASLGGSCFAEKYIDGREFNLSILAGPQGPEVLPPAEIVFKGYAKDQARVVCYRAKWDETSFEYSHTLRRFDFPAKDESLLSQLKTTALRCWHLFGLKGYARVDFRVDSDGELWILEVNTNPCLSPDAGFAAALQHAGLDLTAAVERIINDALLDKPFQKNSRVSFRSTAPSAAVKESFLNQRSSFRTDVRRSDSANIHDLIEKTGFFHSFEVAVAVELVEERLLKGKESGYEFIFLEEDNHLLGYACYGPIACTRSSFDVYWIAVDPEHQRSGIGRLIMAEAERLIRLAGGSKIYVETSQRPLYASTRGFYESCGFRMASILSDYYAPGDGKVIYCKELLNPNFKISF
jgi:D-alanine-D-alanine ligase